MRMCVNGNNGSVMFEPSDYEKSIQEEKLDE
jgi:hypothetical protein